MYARVSWREKQITSFVVFSTFSSSAGFPKHGREKENENFHFCSQQVFLFTPSTSTDESFYVNTRRMKTFHWSVGVFWCVKMFCNCNVRATCWEIETLPVGFGGFQSQVSTLIDMNVIHIRATFALLFSKVEVRSPDFVTYTNTSCVGVKSTKNPSEKCKISHSRRRKQKSYFRNSRNFLIFLHFHLRFIANNFT